MNLRVCLGLNRGRRLADSWCHICFNGVVFSGKFSIEL